MGLTTKIIISRITDNYFLVIENILFNNDKYYKCDEFDGLKELIVHIIDKNHDRP